MSLDVFFQQCVNGLTIGFIYSLIALGYTLVFGILQLINFAHGEIFMLGAFAALFIHAVLGALPPGPLNAVFFLPLVLVLAMAVCAAVGAAVERFAYRPLRQAPRLAPLITAIGVSFLLQNIVMIAFGPTDKSFPDLFPIHKFPIGAGGAGITNLQVLIWSVSLALMAGLHFFIRNTRAGKAMRALSDDRDAASLMGINTNRVIASTFLIGSAMAGAGGVLFGLYYNTVNFHDGYLAGMKAFTAAVLGGIGNIPGAMAGGVILGVLEGFGAAVISSEWKNVFAFVILIIILLIRPNGLFGSRVVKKV
jgi:branched-chain amino acid transport system permease protein